jgi:Meiotically up-regulated gene 113
MLVCRRLTKDELLLALKERLHRMSERIDLLTGKDAKHADISQTLLLAHAEVNVLMQELIEVTVPYIAEVKRGIRTSYNYAPPEGSHTYFIRANNYVKIGHSAELKHRLENIKVCCPHEVELTRTIPSSVSTEKWLHKYFRHLRIRGEWFYYSDEMLVINPPI